MEHDVWATAGNSKLVADEQELVETKTTANTAGIANDISAALA